MSGRRDGPTLRNFPVTVSLDPVPAASLRHDARVLGGQSLTVYPTSRVPVLATRHNITTCRVWLRVACLLSLRRIHSRDNVQTHNVTRHKVRRGGWPRTTYGKSLAREGVREGYRPVESTQKNTTLANTHTHIHIILNKSIPRKMVFSFPQGGV